MVAWILLTYKLHSEPSRARVAVWREIRRSGALHLQQSVVAFPDTPAFREAAADGSQLAESWNAARDAEYAELVGVCERFLAEIEHEFEIEKFTTAEL